MIFTAKDIGLVHPRSSTCPILSPSLGPSFACRLTALRSNCQPFFSMRGGCVSKVVSLVQKGTIEGCERRREGWPSFGGRKMAIHKARSDGQQYRDGFRGVQKLTCPCLDLADYSKRKNWVRGLWSIATDRCCTIRKNTSRSTPSTRCLCRRLGCTVSLLGARSRDCHRALPLALALASRSDRRVLIYLAAWESYNYTILRCSNVDDDC